MKRKTVTLYRPTGPKELDLIEDSGGKKFPPRLPEQPIFYPVLTKEYAIKIARDWNVKDSGIGYVLEFKVKKEFLDNYQVQMAGGNSHQEYWIPAEEIEDFNNALVGKIKVIETYQKWFVYILRCSDNTLYTGITNNLEKRIQQHNDGKGAKYTKGRGPVTLIKCFERLTKGEALKLEYKIKQLPKEEKLKFNV
ncbi:MAG TPA: GIY-YIG nuclease family protein [Candidatus Saccharimonadales bacterium]